MTEAVSEQIESTIHEALPLSESLQDWIQRYKHSPSFYYFQNDLKNIHLTNTKLAFTFLALREAVKGWAIAAKKLPTETSSTGSHSQTRGIQEQDFIFDQMIVGVGFSHPDDGGRMTTSNVAVARPLQKTPTHSVMHQPYALSLHQNAVEQNLLQEYLTLSRNEFSFYMKTNDFWSVRIGVEKIILNSLNLMPALIFSPINVVLKLTAGYKDFPDLLHLLSDHFPTYTVHRLLFSGFMKVASR